MKRFTDVSQIKPAVAAGAGGAGALTGIAVNGTGFGRARFVFNLATGLTGATFDAAIYKASTSGATFSAVTSAALTQITAGSGPNISAEIDVPIDPAKPWLKVSGTVGTSAWPNSAVVEFYRAVGNPPTAGSQQVVTV